MGSGRRASGEMNPPRNGRRIRPTGTAVVTPHTWPMHSKCCSHRHHNDHKHRREHSHQERHSAGSRYEGSYRAHAVGRILLSVAELLQMPQSPPRYDHGRRTTRGANGWGILHDGVAPGATTSGATHDHNSCARFDEASRQWRNADDATLPAGARTTKCGCSSLREVLSRVWLS